MAEAREREKGYRARALKIYPHICARCGRSFEGKKLRELTVHHIDENPENNPPDGSNWENMCIYCHDNEHQRYLEHVEGGSSSEGKGTNDGLTHNPFAALKGILKEK